MVRRSQDGRAGEKRYTQHRKIHKHKSFLLWFTGLSGSGKSTLANLVEIELSDNQSKDEEEVQSIPVAEPIHETEEILPQTENTVESPRYKRERKTWCERLFGLK